MHTIRRFAFLTAGATYLLIVLGGIVRITGSGMGCGPDWPLCNGRLIPSFSSMATVIEWSHRVVALAVIALVGGLAALAMAARRDPSISRSGGPIRSAQLAVLLLALQVLLGAVTVKLELHSMSVILHLGTAMAMLAAILVTGLRANPAVPPPTDPKIARGAAATAGMAALAVLLGALTANLDAGGACLGFPLCSGTLWPADARGGLAPLHWIHRLVGYGLLLHLVGMTMRLRRVGGAVFGAAAGALAVTLLQVIVAAAMMFSLLQPGWRAAHVAAGTAVWVLAVVLAWLAWPRTPGRDARFDAGSADF